jgi:uncharacterized glyoxalase superfamily protein PhnB
MFRIVPQLTVASVKASAAYYQIHFGFEITVADPPDDPVFASLEREDATLFLVSEASREEESHIADLANNKRGVGVRLYLEVDDAREVYDALVSAGVAIFREIAYSEKEEYTEFSVLDPDGYEIGVYS